MTFALNDRVAVITGASGAIGRTVAEVLSAAGASVVIAYGRNREAAERLAGELAERGGVAMTTQGDLSTADGAQQIIRASVERFSRIDILVNNAGITRDGLLMRMKEADWDAVLDTNLKSAYLCAQAAARHLLRSSFGRIINITSVSGVIGNAGQTNYSAAKAGMIGFTKALAREFASRGVTVNAIAPGFIESDMTAALAGDTRDRAVAQIPLGRFGQPVDVAQCVRFLASGEAAYITGQVFCVDGGLAM